MVDTQKILLDNYAKKLFLPLLRVMDFSYSQIEVHDLSRSAEIARYAISCYDANKNPENFTSEQLHFFISALGFVARRVILGEYLLERGIIIQRQNGGYRDKFSQSNKSSLGFYIRKDLEPFYRHYDKNYGHDAILEVRRIYVLFELYNFLAKQTAFRILQESRPIISYNPPGVFIANNRDGIAAILSQMNIAATPQENGNMISIEELNNIMPIPSEDVYIDINFMIARASVFSEDLSDALTQEKQGHVYNLALYDLRKAIYYHDEGVVEQVCDTYFGNMNQATKDDCLTLACHFSSMVILDILIRKFNITEEILSSVKGCGLLEQSLNELMIPWRLPSSGANSNDSANQYQQQLAKINFLLENGARLSNPDQIDVIVARELNDSGGIKVMELEHIHDFQMRILALKQYLGIELGLSDIPAVTVLRRQGSGLTTQEIDTPAESQNSDVSTEIDSQEEGNSQDYDIAQNHQGYAI